MPSALHPKPTTPLPTVPFEQWSGTTHVDLRDYLDQLLENRGYTRADRTTWRNDQVIVMTANSPRGLMIHRFIDPEAEWFSDCHDWRTAANEQQVRAAVHTLIDSLHDMR